MAAALQRLFLAHLLLLSLRTAAPNDAASLLAAKRKLSDPAGALSGWSARRSGRSPCAWPHVACAGNSTTDVAGLYLKNHSLSGAFFPASLCSLRSLQHLDLSQNDIGGPLPACLAALPALAYLDLSGNNFSCHVPAAYGGAGGFRSLATLNLVQNALSGQFPAFLTGITSLQELMLGYNDFTPSPLPENLGDLAGLRLLYLSRCYLKGRIPSSIGNLRNLVNLDMSMNGLSGEIPGSIGNLSSAVQIELYSNQLSGRIPDGLGRLKKLQFLDLSMNRLSGALPEGVFAGPSLQSVHIYENSLTGRLPASLASAPRLADLRLFGNQIEGPFPPEFGKNTPLEFLDMSDNWLWGPIPPTLCASGRLREIMLLNNKLEGAIPVELGQCRSLLRIRLFNNSLSGTVPPEFWALPNVRMLELRLNALSGAIHPAIGGAQNLSKLLLQDNRFTGALPAELGNLAILKELFVSGNNLSGPLPASLVDLSELYTIDLSNNSLSGEIPRDIGRLKKLVQVQLSHNHLTGVIPPELGEIDGISVLDLSHNELSGGVPGQLQKLRIGNLNLSYNKLTGPLPDLFTNGVWYNNSFLGNPGLCNRTCPSNGNSDADRRARIQSVASILAVSAVILLIGFTWFSYKYSSYKRRAAEIDSENSRWVLTSFHKVEFDEKDILNSLDEKNVIGEGAAGKVYKAVVGRRSESALAVKKLWSGTAVTTKMDTFEAEVATLSKVRHRNIVKLFCSMANSTCRLLIYEYMPNGSLGDFLHSAKAGILDWPTRFKIAVHAAEGLSYLHHDCVPSILHRDVKSNNILLDAEFGAKVADFGVAKVIEDGTATMSVVAGSCGYIAPEYAYTIHVTEKSDVYSFGVVILELVTGKWPMASEIGEKDLVAWVRDTVEQNGVESVLDQKLDSLFKDEMHKVLHIGLMCVNIVPNNRPPMRSVVKMLLDAGEENKRKARIEASLPSI